MVRMDERTCTIWMPDHYTSMWFFNIPFQNPPICCYNNVHHSGKTNLGKLCLYGPCFMYRGIIILNLVSLNPKRRKSSYRVQRHSRQLCASNFVAKVWGRPTYGCDGQVSKYFGHDLLWCFIWMDFRFRVNISLLLLQENSFLKKHMQIKHCIVCAIKSMQYNCNSIIVLLRMCCSTVYILLHL